MAPPLDARWALFWERWRVPLVLLAALGALAGTYFAPVARVEAQAALFATPLVAVALALRPMWYEREGLRAAAFATALAALVACELALWAGAPAGVGWALAISGVAAAGLQLYSARRRVRTFFAVGVGVAIALGLYAPGHVDAQRLAASITGVLAVGLLAGGGVGLAVVALADRVAWRHD